VASVPLSAESLVIPNTVALIRGSPHPAEADQLASYLERLSVMGRLVAAGALEDEGAASERGPALRPDWTALLTDLDAVTAQLKGVFLR